MTDNEINAAIAEACGRRQKANGEWFPDNGLTVGSQGIPNYCADLNAMHEAEKSLVQEVEWVRYSVQLAKVTNAEWSDDMDYVCAPARQRAEAFLRTLDKWEEVQG